MYFFIECFFLFVGLDRTSYSLNAVFGLEIEDSIRMNATFCMGFSLLVYAGEKWRPFFGWSSIYIYRTYLVREYCLVRDSWGSTGYYYAVQLK